MRRGLEISPNILYYPPRELLRYNFIIIDDMKSHTDEFSFILKPAEHGIGVFAVHDMEQGTYLRLFGDEDELEGRSVTRDKKNVPAFFREYCIDEGDQLIGPKDFGAMPVGWYLNHSKTPNAVRDENYLWYASRVIKAGEEITIDYNSLEEPEEAKADYYRE